MPPRRPRQRQIARRLGDAVTNRPRPRAPVRSAVALARRPAMPRRARNPGQPAKPGDAERRVPPHHLQLEVTTCPTPPPPPSTCAPGWPGPPAHSSSPSSNWPAPSGPAATDPRRHPPRADQQPPRRAALQGPAAQPPLLRLSLTRPPHRPHLPLRRPHPDHPALHPQTVRRTTPRTWSSCRPAASSADTTECARCSRLT